MRRLADRFPAFAALDAAGLLELIEETNTARALAARGEIEAADACFNAAAARLGITAEAGPLAAAVITGEIGDLT